jgi:hypothetical protein
LPDRGVEPQTGARPRRRRRLAATKVAFAPQYSEFGGFGAIRRWSRVAKPLNSSGLSSNSLCKGTENYYSCHRKIRGLFGDSILGISLGPVRDRSSSWCWIAHSG